MKRGRKGMVVVGLCEHRNTREGEGAERWKFLVVAVVTFIVSSVRKRGNSEGRRQG